MTTETLSTAEAVARYHALRCATVPLEPGGKRPVWQGWTEPRPLPEVLAYFETHPEANLGILLGPASNELRCLDVDDRTAAVELFRSCPELKALPRVRTGRGGHVYFRPSDPEGWPSAKVRFEGEDLGEVLAGGRQAVAPPSHVDGENGRREWLGGWPVDFPPFAPHPEDLGLELLLSKHVTTANGEPPEADRRVPLHTLLQRALDMAHEGNRNDVGLWLACQARDCGYGETETALALRAYVAAVGKGEHPYTWREAEATLRSAFAREAREPWPEPLRLGRKAGQVDTEATAVVATEPRRIQVLSFRELCSAAAEPVPWLAPGWVAAGHTTLLAGPRETMKSCLALEICRAVATGGDFAGERCEQAPCVYFDAENGAKIISTRLKGFGCPEAAPVHVAPLQPLNLLDKSTANEALAVVKEFGARLVCLDSVRRFHTGDENGSEWTQRLYANFLVPLRQAGVGVILLHNAARPRLVAQPGELYRGSSDLGALVDIYAEAVLLERNAARYTFEKYRFSTPPKPVLVTLQVDGERYLLDIAEAPDEERGGPDPGLVARVIEALTESPRLSRSQLASHLGCSKEALRPVLTALESRGVLTHTDGGGNKGFLYERVARPQGEKRESEVLDFEGENEGTSFSV